MARLVTDACVLRPLLLYCNERWRAYLESGRSNGAYEVPFYTDAQNNRRDSCSDLGPYLLINTVPMPLKSGYGVALPAIILRAEIHHRRDPYEFPPMTATDDSIYHGGDLEDEIAIAQRRCTKAPPFNILCASTRYDTTQLGIGH